MKLFASLLGAILLGIVLAGCQSNDVTAPDGQASSMKGYELYSWQDDGQWRFSLLEGTNREKTLDEIRSPDSSLKGIEALKPALENIRAGQWVTWLSRDTLAFPPADVMRRVEQISKDQGLQLSVVR